MRMGGRGKGFCSESTWDDSFTKTCFHYHHYFFLLEISIPFIIPNTACSAVLGLSLYREMINCDTNEAQVLEPL